MKNKIVGIYQILNTQNNKVYIGSSIDIKKRWREHKNALRKNIHQNSYLQNAWNKWEEKLFEFSTLEECSMENLKEKEEYYINLYESCNRKKGYNIEKISYGAKIVLEETRKKMSCAKQGRYEGEDNPNFGNGDRVRGENNPMFGRHHSKESKLKMSISRKGEKNPSSKLSWKQVREIRQKFVPYKYTAKMLSEEYGISYFYIYAIIKNKKWKE